MNAREKNKTPVVSDFREHGEIGRKATDPAIKRRIVNPRCARCGKPMIPVENTELIAFLEQDQWAWEPSMFTNEGIDAFDSSDAIPHEILPSGTCCDDALDSELRVWMQGTQKAGHLIALPDKIRDYFERVFIEG